MIPVHRGQFQLAQKKLLENLASFQSQKLTEPANEIYFCLALLAAETGDYASTLKYAKKRVLERKEEDPHAFIRWRDFLAWAHLRNGDSKAANQVLGELRKDLTQNQRRLQPAYDYLAGVLAYEKGKYEPALEQFQKALKPLSPNRAPQYRYAVCLLKTGHVTEALSELERLTWWTSISTGSLNLNFLPTLGHWSIASVKAHYWLGVAYEQQGNKVKAREEYEKFLEIWKETDFNSPELADAKARLAKLKQTAAK